MSSHRGFFVTGTDTEVGKTLVAAALTIGLRRHGYDVAVIKPIATGAIRKGNRLIAEDTAFLQRATEGRQTISEVTPSSYTFEIPASPHFAAQLADRQIERNLLFDFFQLVNLKYPVVIVEAIGGILVPISDDWMVADMAQAFALPLVIVARSGLGTLNHTLLTLEAARRRGLTVAGVVFSQTSAPACEHQSPWTLIEQDNISTIKRLGSVEILGAIPYISDLPDFDPIEAYRKTETYIDWGKVLKWIQ